MPTGRSGGAVKPAAPDTALGSDDAREALAGDTGDPPPERTYAGSGGPSGTCGAGRDDDVDRRRIRLSGDERRSPMVRLSPGGGPGRRSCARGRPACHAVATGNAAIVAALSAPSTETPAVPGHGHRQNPKGWRLTS